MYGKAKEISDYMKEMLHNSAQPMQLTGLLGDAVIRRLKKQGIEPKDIIPDLEAMIFARDRVSELMIRARSYLHSKEEEFKTRRDYSRKEFSEYISGHLVTMARPKRIKLTLRRFELPRRKIFLNESLMYNASSNIITNAHETGATQMYVDCWTDKNYFLMAFEDNGEGMTPQVLARCRERGFTTKEHGEGIGVASIEESLKEENGYLDIAS